MAKPSDNFLRGWCRQVRAALDEGAELGYEAAELILELEDLITPLNGGGGDEVDEPDASDGDGARQAPHGAHDGTLEDDESDVPRLARRLGDSPGFDDSAPGVPRGTGSGAPTCRRRGA